MPDIVVHASMGRQVLQRLKLSLNEEVFAYGLLGPDPFLFYRFYVPPFRHRVNRYSSIMHRHRTGDFLTRLAREADDDAFAYLTGFLCHYALDSTTHPYIVALAKGDSAMHLAIEHRLDRLDGGPIVIPPLLPERIGIRVGESIARVYGWTDAWEKLRLCHEDMRRFYRLVEDPSGRLDRLLGWTGGPAATLSYRSRICDHMDLSGFGPLYERAIDEAATYVQAAEAYRKGEIGEEGFRRVIGSRSYIGG